MTNSTQKSFLFTQICITYGVIFQIGSDNESGLDLIKKNLPINVVQLNLRDYLETPVQFGFGLRQNDQFWEFSFNDELVWINSSLISIGSLIESFIRLKIAEHSTEFTFVHTGVVNYKQNIILIPADSRAGKSTLVKYFLEKGGEYLSDEYALIDDGGRVFPYQKPLSLRENFYGLQTDYDLNDLGFKIFDRQPCKASYIIFTVFDENAVWNPVKLTNAEAVLHLFAHTVSARNQPQTALHRLSEAVSEALCVKSPRKDCETVAKWMEIRLN